jgi:hypothetical protein
VQLSLPNVEDLVTHKVVAHYIGGRVVKGVSHDINPKRPFCHIRTADQGTISVKLSDLKALFFVKDLTGDPKRQEGRKLESQDPRARGAVPIEVDFGDGERIVGLTSGYPPQSTFFFVWPVDSRSNNMRILVNQGAVARMASGHEQLPTPPSRA